MKIQKFEQFNNIKDDIEYLIYKHFDELANDFKFSAEKVFLTKYNDEIEIRGGIVTDSQDEKKYTLHNNTNWLFQHKSIEIEALKIEFDIIDMNSFLLNRGSKLKNFHLDFFKLNIFLNYHQLKFDGSFIFYIFEETERCKFLLS